MKKTAQYNSHLPRTTWKCLLIGMDNWGTGLDMTDSGFAKILNLRERRQNLCNATLCTMAFWQHKKWKELQSVIVVLLYNTVWHDLANYTWFFTMLHLSSPSDLSHTSIPVWLLFLPRYARGIRYTHQWAVLESGLGLQITFSLTPSRIRIESNFTRLWISE